MSKTSSQSAPNVIGRARGPRGFGGPVVKAKDKKGTMKRIWRYMERQKMALIASIIFVIISTLLGLLGPYLIGVIIDEYIIPKDIDGTLRFLVITSRCLYCCRCIYLAANVFDGAGIIRDDSGSYVRIYLISFRPYLYVFLINVHMEI